MNATIPNADGLRSRRRAILVALLVALVSLTITPGFECTRKEADGSETTVKF